jgi:XisH protein
MAKDVIHDAVKEALENDGWTITSEHYTVRFAVALMVVQIEQKEIVAWIE